ncbi:CDP-alcohol phosphatidyltransferase family protein [Phenylobacterium sp. LjRoot219]|uniref:CDP-alcohol phosphatidyltransferase family protein n=1 Tax=Phenylobacterium sp. LjRoot219 TaxID=3342283 RepID=UPI003ECF5C3C
MTIENTGPVAQARAESISGWGALGRVLCWPNNLVTLSRIVITGLIVASLFAGVQWNPYVATAVFMAVFWYTDTLDGQLARRLKKTSSFGESMDLVADCVCDLIACSYLLSAHPQYTGVVIFFLLARFGPDVLVIRWGGLTPSVYATLMQQAAQSFLPGGGGLVKKAYAGWAIESYSFGKAVFFCGAMFWNAPVWTGVLVIIPAAVFLIVALVVMRLHAEQVLAERRANGLEP